MCILACLLCLLCPAAPQDTDSTSACIFPHVRPSFPYADGWLGGDGALSVCLPDGRVLWIFSDSYVSGNEQARTRKKARTMVNNCVALASYGREQDMHYYWRRKAWKHQAFFIPPEEGIRLWPGLAWLRQDSLFVLSSRIGDPAEPDPGNIFNFSLQGLNLAVVTGIHDPDPLKWHIDYHSLAHIIPGTTLNQAGVDAHYLYAFLHADSGNFLLRMPQQLLTRKDPKPQYWSRRGQWISGKSGPDAALLYKGQSNGSLDYLPELGCWLHVYGPNFLSNEIRYRFAPNITGPWSEARLLHVTPEQSPGHPSYDRRHFCYLARVHPLFSDLEGGRMTVIYDCNSVEFSHVARSDEIYIPGVVELEIPSPLKNHMLYNRFH